MNVSNCGKSYVPNYLTRINLKNKIKEACINGNLCTLQHLMTFVSENNTSDNEIIQYVNLACTNNHTNIVNWFIMNEYLEDFNPILYWVCEFNIVDSIDLIINKIKRTDRFNELCWYGAFVGGHLNIMCVLIDKNILPPLNLTKLYQEFYGFIYAGQGNLDSLLFVLDSLDYCTVQDGIFTINNEYIKSCLLVRSTTTPSVKYIEDTEIIYKRTICNNILQGACSTGNMQIIKFAIDNGANCFNLGMATACMYDHLEVVKLMIHHGADDWNSGLTNGCDCGYSCGRNCFHYCHCKEKTLESVLYMIECGANSWNESFINACSCGNMETVKLMIHCGANNWNDGFMQTCYAGHTDIANLIIKSGTVDLNEGFNEFMRSFEYKYTNETNINFMKLLVREGATNLNHLADVEEFKLACLYCRHIGRDPTNDTKCNDMLKTYPLYTLLCGKAVKTCGILNNGINYINKLPQELFRLLHEYL